MLIRLGRFCSKRHWPVIIAWLIVIVVLVAIASKSHGESKDVFTIPGTQSQQAVELLQTSFPAANGTSAFVTFQAQSGTLTDPAHQPAVAQAVTNLKGIQGVNAAGVVGPFDPTPTGLTFNEGNPQLQTAQLNINSPATGSTVPANTVGYANVAFTTPLESVEQATTWYTAMQAATQPATAAGVTVNYGGAVIDLANAPKSPIPLSAEEIGLIAAVIILLIALGSVTSMLVPILVALISVGISEILVVILEAHITIGSVAPILGAMIGLGVGIDYSLFILSRHRQNYAEGVELHESVARSIATSGSAVLFAGLTVCIALLGLVIVGIPYVFQLGYISSMFVGVAILAALTLVPAILGALGPKVNSLRIHKRDETADIHKTLSARWASETSRHPVIFALLSLAILLLLAAPVRKMELGFTDDGNANLELTQRQAYDVLTTNFGPGVNGPLLLAVDLPPVTNDNGLAILEAFGKLDTAVAATPGVARVSLPIPNQFPSNASPTAVPTAVIVQVVPTTSPNSEATTDLVKNLRDAVIPAAVAGTPIAANQVFVGGQTAILIDLTHQVNQTLWKFISVVLLGAFLLLMMVFRSLFVPFKAAIMNLLSIGAAFGVIVVMFQWGWGKDAIGLATTVPVVAFVPVMMFAVLFGLSMDYEVFLISRIKEEYGKSGESRESVVTGLAATARVITAAALIMICVFLANVPNPDPTVKMIGMGMAVAVFIDATIVRMMLVPSTMELAGKANWWIPKWLDKILPHIHVE